MLRHGMDPGVLADNGVRARAAAVELTNMLWREGAEDIHHLLSDGEMWWLNIQVYWRALTTVQSGKVDWLAAARRLTAGTMRAPSGSTLIGVIGPQLLKQIRQHAEKRAIQGVMVQKVAWSDDTITLLAATAVQFRRDWFGMPWWPALVDAALEHRELAWASSFREQLLDDPSKLGAEVLNRLALCGFRYLSADGVRRWG
jgi:hypothetical protein